MTHFLPFYFVLMFSGKKRKRLSTTPEVSKGVFNADVGAENSQPKLSESHAHNPPHEDLQPPTKRLREEEKQRTVSSILSSSVSRPSRPKGRRTPSPEVIPDSDEETDRIQAYLSPARQEREPVFSEPSQAVEALDAVEAFDPLFDEPHTKIPEHISRRTNPLVKMVDASTMNLQGAIAAKVRALREPNVGSSSNVRVRPGPGRSSGGLLIKQKTKSSLFTAEKGSVKIVKGKYKKDDVILKDQEPSPTIYSPADPFSTAENVDINKLAPSADELLQLAGLDQTATDLADFEDPKPADRMPENHSATTEVGQPTQNSSNPNELSAFGSGYVIYT